MSGVQKETNGDVVGKDKESVERYQSSDVYLRRQGLLYSSGILGR